MAIKLDVELKNEMLDDAFCVPELTYYISIPNVVGAPGGETMPNQVVSFKTPASGRTELAVPVQFAVNAGTYVNTLYISTKPINGASVASDFDTITLEGDEIGDFTAAAGIYLISSITINVKDGI